MSECCEWCGADGTDSPLRWTLGGLTYACSRVTECRSRNPDIRVCAMTAGDQRCYRPAGHTIHDPGTPHYDAGEETSWE